MYYNEFMIYPTFFVDCMVFNFLPSDKMLVWSKFNAFADDKINAT